MHEGKQRLAQDEVADKDGDRREHHGLGRPEFKLDRLQRYIAWFDKYLAKAE